MQRYKHIFIALEKELNNSLLAQGISQVPVQMIKDVDEFYDGLPHTYQRAYRDYVKFYTCNKYKSDFVNDMMFEIIVEQHKIKKAIKDNVNINILKELIPDLYLVGGCIRDIINGACVKDYDVCTSLNYEEVRKCVAGLSYTEAGKQFLVNIVTINNEQFEIATFRKDKSNDGGIQGTIEEDAQRRDFTCNALYFDLHTEELIDPNGGFEDTYSKTLRFIGNPKDRIKEDPCRVFRFYRFISEKGYTEDKKALKACRENFDYAVKNTNSQRILKELERIVKI